MEKYTPSQVTWIGIIMLIILAIVGCVYIVIFDGGGPAMHKDRYICSDETIVNKTYVVYTYSSVYCMIETSGGAHLKFDECDMNIGDNIRVCSYDTDIA